MLALSSLRASIRVSRLRRKLLRFFQLTKRTFVSDSFCERLFKPFRELMNIAFHKESLLLVFTLFNGFFVFRIIVKFHFGNAYRPVFFRLNQYLDAALRAG
jgi:hypothetical protein